MGDQPNQIVTPSTPVQRERIVTAFDDMVASIGYFERGRYTYSEVKHAHDDYRVECWTAGEPAFALSDFGEMTSIPRDYPAAPLAEPFPVYENRYYDTPTFQEYRVRRDAIIHERISHISDDDLAKYLKRRSSD